jgi:hypothetical protein
MRKIDMEQVINDFVNVLPQHEMVGTEVMPFTGKDLKLSGIKTFKGEPLKDDTIYPLDVPVLTATCLEDGEPVLKVIDHKHKMRVAWLTGGLRGFYQYLEQYLSAEQLTAVKKHFMKASK